MWKKLQRQLSRILLIDDLNERQNSIIYMYFNLDRRFSCEQIEKLRSSPFKGRFSINFCLTQENRNGTYIVFRFMIIVFQKFQIYNRWVIHNSLTRFLYGFNTKFVIHIRSIYKFNNFLFVVQRTQVFHIANNPAEKIFVQKYQGPSPKSPLRSSLKYIRAVTSQRGSSTFFVFSL